VVTKGVTIGEEPSSVPVPSLPTTFRRVIWHSVYRRDQSH
jgi:hypothetical protein